MSSNAIFHAGDLQSGIAKAIEESKAVVIFLRDDSRKSEKWAQDLLTRQTVSDLLESTSIVLQISKDTQEEAFLSAFCKVNEYPSLVVIKDGKLQAQLGPDLDFEELEAVFHNFKTQGSMEETPSTSSPVSTPASNEPSLAAQPSSASASASRRHDPAPTQFASPHPLTTPSNTTSSTSSPTPNPPTSPSKGKGKGKARASSPPPSLPSTAPPPKSAPQLDWISKQRQRQLEAKSERARIMAQIEADKAERRADASRRKHEQLGVAEVSTPSPTQRQQLSTAQTAHLSIRLLSGATVRHTLPSSASLAQDLRPYLASTCLELEGRAYTFKLLQSPLPARPIEVGEEHGSLSELGLAPSATLVLVEVRGGSEAYSSRGGLLGVPWSVVSGVAGVVESVVGAAGGWLGYGTGGAGGGDAATSTAVDEGSREGEEQQKRGGGIRVRTLADQRAEGEGDGEERNRWYNGNQLSFEAEDDELEE